MVSFDAEIYTLFYCTILKFAKNMASEIGTDAVPNTPIKTIFIQFLHQLFAEIHELND